MAQALKAGLKAVSRMGELVRFEGGFKHRVDIDYTTTEDGIVTVRAYFFAPYIDSPKKDFELVSWDAEPKKIELTNDDKTFIEEQLWEQI